MYVISAITQLLHHGNARCRKSLKTNLKIELSIFSILLYDRDFNDHNISIYIYTYICICTVDARHLNTYSDVHTNINLYNKTVVIPFAVKSTSTSTLTRWSKATASSSGKWSVWPTASASSLHIYRISEHNRVTSLKQYQLIICLVTHRLSYG